MRVRTVTVALLLAACGGDDPRDRRPAEADTDPGVTSVDADSGSAPTTSHEDPRVQDVSVAVLADLPTVARVRWTQLEAAEAHLTFTFEDDVWAASPLRQLGAGEHEELILGVPYDTDVTFRVVVDGVEAYEGRVRTGSPSPEMPVASVSTRDETSWDPELDHVFVAISEAPRMFDTRSWSVLLDRRGRVVWAHRSPVQRVTTHPRVSWAGDALLVDHSSFSAAFDDGRASEVVALKIDGSIDRVWPTPGQHHPYTDLPDGRVIYASYRKEPGQDPDDDVLVVVDPDTGARRDLVGCEALLLARGQAHDWCGSNTVTYDEARNALLFSLFTQEGIFQIDLGTGAVTHVFGHIRGAWSFSPPSSAFWFQHGPVYTPDGTLLVSSHLTGEVGPDPQDLVVREYRLDPENAQLVEVWSFGEGQGVPGYQMGEAHRLPGGNTLHNHGTTAVLREITRDGRVVWDVRWNTTEEHQLGRSAPVLVDLYAFAPARP